MVTASQTITRLDLSATFSEFNGSMQNKGFIGTRALRPVAVGIQAADVAKIPIEVWLKVQGDARAAGAAYKRGDFEFEKFAYSTDEHGWEEVIDDRKLALYRGIINAEEIHTDRAIGFVQRNYEIDVAALVFNITTWTGAALTTAVSNEWDDATNATPIADVEAARRKIRLASGLEPNALICTRNQAWNALQTAEVIDRFKYSGHFDPKKFVDYTEADLARILGLKYCIIAGGLKDSANEGQSFSGSSVWSEEYAMVCRVAETDDPQEACIGRTFIWTGDGALPGSGDDNEIAVTVEEYREESVRGSVVRARTDRDEVIMYPQAGHLLSNMVT